MNVSETFTLKHAVISFTLQNTVLFSHNSLNSTAISRIKEPKLVIIECISHDESKYCHEILQFGHFLTIL